MEDEYVQALQYTPHPGPSLEVVRTLSLHALLSLSSPFYSVLCILSLALLQSSLEMSESVRATNQPGVTSQEMSAEQGDHQEPGSSSGGKIPAANAAQGKNPPQV